MSNFLRPEVRAFFWRWREVLLAFVVLLLGIWWALTGVGINVWLGYIFCLIGIGWGVAAVQRARFAQDGDGPGVVQIRERRLAYFGPLDGGIMDVADLSRLEIDPTSHPDPSWVLTSIEGQVLTIPINAKGAEDLFDVFAALPDIKTTTVLDVLSHTPDARVTVWSRVKPLLH
ncbi:hypothetical protein [Roseobacter sp. CCS2]|uniref:hypothetical protein n=1 Tax=Roseobacter sp. CCS2 TaxID=391593 RepID=UPI0000F3E1D0|nr:hypothetical protein [Roseobacter sp. CCS2]EBA12085.1 hypothetical protein RCCS2_12349 [Roseobacter sp. CCS2]